MGQDVGDIKELAISKLLLTITSEPNALFLCRGSSTHYVTLFEEERGFSPALRSYPESTGRLC